jgi:IclR family KDG regulon transcriptional repressor
MPSQQDSIYRIDAIVAVADILELYLRSDKAALGVTEISQQTGYDKSRVYRVLRTLLDRGYMQVTENRAYRLGLRFLDLGEFVKKHLDLLDAASAPLHDLAHQCGDTALLNVRDGRDAVRIAQHHGGHVLQVVDRVHQRGSLHAGGSPRLLLAFAPEPERAAILDELDLRPVTPYTITDKGELLRSMARLREQGYAETDEEMDLGVCAVAAPVRDHTGAVVAAVSIVGPKDRFAPPRRQRLIDQVMDCGDEISRRLGYSREPWDQAG